MNLTSPCFDLPFSPPTFELLKILSVVTLSYCAFKICQIIIMETFLRDIISHPKRFRSNSTSERHSGSDKVTFCKRNNQQLLEKKSNLIVQTLAFVFLLGAHPVWAQNALRTFNWDRGDNGHGFWRKAINCGNNNQPGGAGNTKGSKVTFGVTSERRFPGTNSAEFWTNSNFEETCNQNHSSERAEMSSYADYRALGVREGATVWFGWSEKYTDLDESHTTTCMQIRSNCSSGSPTTKINLNPGRKLVIKLRELPGFPGRVVDIGQIKEDVWYDFVVEVKYAKNNSGYIKVWMYEVGTNSGFSYNNPTAQILNRATMAQGDNCPHIRWGLYRHQSGDKRPSQINPADRMMVKYVAPVKIHLGNNLGATGFEIVRPKDPSGNTPPPPPPPVPTAPDVPCTLSAEWSTAEVGSTGIDGESCENEGEFTISGSGADIWNTQDQFHFLYKKITGDAEITARLTQLTQADKLSKTGVMMRNNLSTGSQHVFMSLSASAVRSFQYRDAEDGTTTNKSQQFGAYSPPHWVKLIRKGNTFTGYYSEDGVDYTVMDQIDIPMGTEIYLGVAVNSHTNSATATAVFDNLLIQANTTLDPTSEPGTGLCFDEASGRLVFEAENFSSNVPGIDEAIETQWNVQPDVNGSGGEVMYADGPGFNSQDRKMGGRMDYEISFERAGTYYVWARMMGKSLADDSFHAGLNGNPETLGGYGFTTINHNAWVWVGSVLGKRVTIDIPSPGSYTFNAWIREDGTYLDKFIISSDESYLPIGFGPAESPACTVADPGECSGTDNLALNKDTRQSSIYGLGSAGVAVDGDLDGGRGPWQNASITHTNKEAEPWWEVDLGDYYEIDEIKYMGRTDCCGERLRNAYIMASPTPFNDNSLQVSLAKDDVKYIFSGAEPTPWNTIGMEKFVARYVRIQLRDTNPLSLTEVQVFGCKDPVRSQSNTGSEKFADPYSTVSDPTVERMTLAPNPTSGDTRVLLSNDYSGSFKIQVHDMLGREVKREVFVKDTPQFNYMLLLGGLPVGFYTVTVTHGAYTRSERLSITR